MTYREMGVFLLKAAALLLVAGYSAFGENPAWVGGSNPLKLYVDSTNACVGIGTASPASKLHVTDTLTLGSFPSSYAQIYQNTETDDCLYINNHRAVTGSNIYFQTGSMTKMTILQSGAVGIGTASPASKLHVTDTLTLGSFPSSYAQIYQNTETDDCLYINNHRAVTGSNIYFQTGSMTKMTILQNGNVGIDINPTGTERLQVNGKIKVWDNINLYGHYLSGDGDNEGIFIDESGNITIYGTAVIRNADIQYDLRAAFLTTGQLAVDNDINASGNISAGGDINVNGRVNIKGWYIQAPDYVFDDKYKLRKLPEVEKYVKENKHLPDVPSAKEMKEKGVDLVEMNMKLLQKVEELTLYTLEGRKIAEEQGKIIAKQQREIEELRRMVGKGR